MVLVLSRLDKTNANRSPSKEMSLQRN